MAEKRRGLGRGLGALIATGPTEPVEEKKATTPSSEEVEAAPTPASRETTNTDKRTPAYSSADQTKLVDSSSSKADEKSPAAATGDVTTSAETGKKKSSTASVDPGEEESSKGSKSGESTKNSDAEEPADKESASKSGADDSQEDSTTSVANAVDVLRKRTSERRRKALADTVKAEDEKKTPAETQDSSKRSTVVEENEAELDADGDEVPRIRPVDMFFGGSPSPRSNVSRETSRANRRRAQVPDLLSERAARVLKNREDNGTDVEEQAETTSPAPKSTGNTSAAADSKNSEELESSKNEVTRPTGEEKSDAASDRTSSVDKDEIVAQKSDVSRETLTDSDQGDNPSGSDVEDLASIPGLSYAELPIDSIHPNRKQPRQVFDEEDMSELEHSIREIGLLQPIVVRPSSEEGDAKYELVMGERRWRAAQRVGMEQIPAIIRETKDEDLLRDALLENLHRSELNPLEEAAAYQQLLQEFGCSQDELSQKIGRSRSQISNTIRLMKLPPLVQRRVAAGVISQGHARALLSLEDVAEMERLAQRIVNEGLSVRSVEEIVALQAGLRRADNTRQAKEVARPERLDYFANALSDRLDTQVKITLGAKKGRVSIEFASVDDLNRIMGVIAPSN